MADSLTTRRRGLSRAEAFTTGLALVVSSALYAGGGHRYLARGVLGDVLGLGILASIAVSRRRRLRHEAVFCLGCIGMVVLVEPRWPLAVPGTVSWPLVAVAVAAYVALRNRLLPGAGSSGRAERRSSSSAASSSSAPP